MYTLVTIKMRDGTERKFSQMNRNAIRNIAYEGNVVELTSEHHHHYAFPLDLVAEVVAIEDRGW